MTIAAQVVTDLRANTSTARQTTQSKRVIVDFTDLIGHLKSGRGTDGIPRVLLEFANAATTVARERDITLLFGYFDQPQGIYLRLAPICAEAESQKTLDWLLNDPRLFRGYPRLIDLSKLRRKYADQPLRLQWHLAYARLRLVRRRLVHMVLRALSPDYRTDVLEFQAGDVLLMLGSGWDAMPTIDYVEPLHKVGIVTPVILIHDLIPLLKVPSDDILPASSFQPWLDRIIRMSIPFIANSKATQADLLNYCEQENVDISFPPVVTLPHELTAPPVTLITPEVQSVLSKHYALFVGPVCGRKNAVRLLEAWSNVLAHLGPEMTPTLVITDSRGAENVYQTHIRPVKSHVLLLNRPSDYELSELYRNAGFTVFPSLYEGWGLPVGESLWHGIPCITSNTSSLPEVGGPLCDYIDPTSVDSIAEAVERFASDKNYRDRRAKEIARSGLRTWQDFARDVLDAALSDCSSTRFRSDTHPVNAKAPTAMAI